MELIGYDVSRIVYLTNFVRREGSGYLPEIAQRVIQTYSFLKSPSADDLQKDAQTFAMGKFQGIQINELSVYGDGIIVSGRCSTQTLQDFIADLFAMMTKDFGYIETRVLEPEMHYESSLIVRSGKALDSVIAPPQRVTTTIEQTLRAQTRAEYRPIGFNFETDVSGLGTRRRPVRFSLERRLGVPFSKNVFYSQAPITSADHLALLEKLEQIAD
ncbi:hypothetical protein RX330_31805 [Bradyrhizobium sp. NDS-1]|uniref:hypothetical protein n=1 Tax=Bradyrhizobium sp. NDS-1 TaxID=3080014 RepID=UPI00293EF6F9|nr:hypothetical protein [Bradyrhizobium sp. NDS-1]WOH72814.1 hypothetical protein RX330_31805 [Bradyrhizobium sp. NDS-1]